MPNARRRYPVQKPSRGARFAGSADQSAILAKTLFTNRFTMPAWNRDKAQGITLGGWSFQKIKEGLRRNPGT